MLFNIYYLNFSKVYEIKMMLSNVIKTDESIETGQNDTVDAAMQAKMGTKFLKLFNAEIGSDIKSGSTDSQKVLENFKVTMTKSLILSEVMDKCKPVTDFNSLEEGQLIRIDKVSLSLENETELRTVKMFSNGSFKGMNLPESGGLDINNLFNSMFKDYSYKLKGEINNSKEKVLIKIPLTFENEFENMYNVDDLFIGKVSLIGIYKGKTKVNGLKNSFEFFQELSQFSKSDSDSEVHNSQYIESTVDKLKGEDEDIDYNYIDLLAIIQVIKSQDSETDDEF
ncbi:hypothetical protein EXD82_03190 [Peptacetobacter hominis]|uniref:Uncharacterized protein n=1 Tax=Peptacetobacter hominis TaxID=2743610 RepID=A0A544QWQ9_9FIRM|nr:hypothetical protein [Peptacetobacter hominis]TQQ85115.1 hypothetical protein EXD82_03190 [Peptacetobacter hominis]